MSFVIYAVIFRVAVITTGLACVYMGYRLFVRGVMPQDGSDVDAKAGEIRFTLKNAAPGTCFAAFGALLIAIMLIQGNPEMNMLEYQSVDSSIRHIRMRGDVDDFSTVFSRGRYLEREGRLDEAVMAYAQGLSNPDLNLLDATEPLRAIASIYEKQGRYDEAVAYARLANQIQPNKAEGLALLAEIQWKRGKFSEAIQAMEQASAIDCVFEKDLEQMRGRKR